MEINEPGRMRLTFKTYIIMSVHEYKFIMLYSQQKTLNDTQNCTVPASGKNTCTKVHEKIFDISVNSYTMKHCLNVALCLVADEFLMS